VQPSEVAGMTLRTLTRYLRYLNELREASRGT
jgi:hypothetical protein